MCLFKNYWEEAALYEGGRIAALEFSIFEDIHIGQFFLNPETFNEQRYVQINQQPL